MKKYVAGSVGIGALLLGLGYIWKKKFPCMSLKQYTKACLYMAVLDDEICRNEWEGCLIEGKKVVFPSKADSLQYRYHLFLEMYLAYTREQMDDEVHRLEKRLAECKKLA